jgi:hypothetical protein
VTDHPYGAITTRAKRACPVFLVRSPEDFEQE